MKNLLSLLLFFCFFAFLTTGCGMPGIILIDDPLTPAEHIELGAAYEKQGEMDLAEKEYRLAGKKDPLGFLYLGNLYFVQGALGPAEKAYKRAIRQMPDNFEAHNNLAWLYYTRKTRLDRAEELARRAVELAPPGHKEQPVDTLEKIRELRTSPKAP